MKWCSKSIFWIVSVIFVGCSGLQTESKQPIILGSYANHQVTDVEITSELKRTAPALLSAETVSEASIEDFVDRYIEFRLKVEDGLKEGYHLDPELVTELSTYKYNLAVAKIIEGELKKELVQELAERRKIQINASHILARVVVGPDGDTTIVWNRLERIKSALASGRTFEQTAKQFSDDPSAEQNMGNLGWFSGGDMIYSFENAVYNAPLDSIIGPIKTDFGYHLIKVHGKRPTPAPRYVSHIMLANLDDSLYAKSKADSIYSLLRNGQSFRDLAVRFSTDKSTSSRGGALGEWKNSGRVPQFDQVVFTDLTTHGQISNVVKTFWGYHIVRLDSIGAPKPVEEKNTEYGNIVSRDPSRMLSKRTEFFNKISKKHAVVFDEVGIDSLSDVVKNINSLRMTGKVLTVENFLTDDKSRTIKLASGGLGNYQAIDLLIQMAKMGKLEIFQPEPGLNKFIIHEHLKNYIVEDYLHRLDEFDPEFKEFLTSFRDGLVMFKWMEKKIWITENPTDDQLQPLFSELNPSLKWGERGVFVHYRVNDSKAADSLMFLIKNVTPEKLIAELTKFGVFESVDTLKYEKDKTAYLGDVWNLPRYELSKKTMTLDGRPGFVQFIDLLSPTSKTFAESRQELVRLYNERMTEKRQSDVINGLRQSATISVDKDAIKKYVSQLKKKSK